MNATLAQLDRANRAEARIAAIESELAASRAQVAALRRVIHYAGGILASMKGDTLAPLPKSGRIMLASCLSEFDTALSATEQEGGAR